MASDENQDIHEVLTAVHQIGETRHQFQTSLLGRKSKNSQDGNERPQIVRQHTQPCHIKLSPSKVKGAPISKSNLLPFSEHQYQPKKFVSPSHKEEAFGIQYQNKNPPSRGQSIYGLSQVGGGGWTSSSSGTRKLQAAAPPNPQKVLEFISPTFSKVRNNGLMFSDIMIPGGQYPTSSNPTIDSQLSAKNGKRINTQDTASSSYVNKITIHKSNQGYDKFSNTMKLKHLMASSADSQSVLIPSHLNRNHIFIPQPPTNGKSSFVITDNQLPTMSSVSSSFKNSAPSQSKFFGESTKPTSYNNSLLGSSVQPKAYPTPEKQQQVEKQQNELDQILLSDQKQISQDPLAMTFSPSQEIKAKVVEKKDGQTPERKAQLLNVAKSLPSLSNRGNKNSGIQGMINRHQNMINQAQTTQQKERQHYREVMGMNENPLFIQSLDQSVHHPIPPPTMNSIEIERFLELITSVNPNKPFSASIDHPYIAAALAYQKRQTNTSNQTSQRYQHVQVSQNQNKAGSIKIISQKKSVSPSPEKVNNNKTSCNPSTTYSTQVHAQGISSYQSISNEVVQGQKPPGIFNGNESGGVHRTKQKGSKYSNNINKFAVIAQSIPLQPVGLVPTVSILSDDYPKSSSQTYKGKSGQKDKAGRKKNVAGFRLNVNPSQGLISIASSINQGILHSNNERNQNMLDLAVGLGGGGRTTNFGSEDRRTMISMNGMQVMKKDLQDRPQSRPQTVHGSTSSSVDLTKEQLFQLKHPSMNFVEQNIGNKELLQSIIKDIIMQRQILHKQHLKNVGHIRRPSSSASGVPRARIDSQHDNLLKQTKAITVNGLIKLNADLKDAPLITTSVPDTSGPDLLQSDTLDLEKLENFTKEEYMRIVQEWANLRKINTSFGTSSEEQVSFQKLAGQIFPLEMMGANGGLGILFDTMNGERTAKDIIRKRHINGKIQRPKNFNRNAQINKQKEVQQQSPLYMMQMAGELIDQESGLRQQKTYPKATIEIFHKFGEEDQLFSYADHPVNKAIAAINSFIYVTFRSKASQSVNIILDHLKPEFKKYNLPLPPRGMPITGAYLRSKEFLSVAKYVLMTLLCNKINTSNDFDPKQYEQQVTSHKYFVGRGNNDHIVRVILKQRFYCNWTLKDKMAGLANNIDPVIQLEETTLEDVNFIWTQVKRQHIVNQIDPYTRLNETPPKIMNSRILESTLRTYSNPSSPEKSKPLPLRMYGKIENNYHLSNKKALFANMKLYYEALNQDPFEVLPLTFHIKNGIDDPEFKDFKRTFQEFAKNPAFKNVWIVKPGENTNRGHGIQVVSSLTEVQAIVRSCNSSSLGYYSTFIVQKYIERPLLIKRRKFDIRTYGLWTSISGVQKGYYYNDGYIRTSCKEYNTNNLNNKYIHLTNDAIQKQSDDYGKFENGNKLTFKDFQKYLDQNYPLLNIDFYRDMLPQIKKIVQDSYRAVYGKLDPQKRLQGFEIFGYDFMIDEDFRIYLIEVNTNPCLETSCPLLARIISEMLDNSFRIAFDPVFYHTLVSNQNTQLGGINGNDGAPKTPGEGGARSMSQANTPGNQNNKKQMSINPISDLSITLIKYELVFDEKVEGSFLREKVLTKTMFDPADNVYLQEDDEQADKQEDPCNPADICIGKELEAIQVNSIKPDTS